MRQMYFLMALVLVCSSSSLVQAQTEDIACCELPFAPGCIGTDADLSSDDLQIFFCSLPGTSFFPGEVCDAEAGVCVLPVSVCGDGIITEELEECDEGAANSDEPNALCRTDCTRAECGDLIIDFDTEQCDDGNGDPTDSCDECMVTSHKRYVCHKGNTIEVANAAIPAHLRHGDSLGLCSE